MRFCSITCRNKGLVTRTGTPPPPMKGEANPSSKLTAKEVRAIRQDARAMRVIAKDYGVGKTTIHRIKRFLLWKSVK